MKSFFASSVATAHPIRLDGIFIKFKWRYDNTDVDDNNGCCEVAHISAFMTIQCAFYEI